MKTTRFSKKELAASIWNEIDRLEKEYGFTSYYGWSQVNGKGEELNRAYGKYEYLFEIIDEFDLPCTN